MRNAEKAATLSERIINLIYNISYQTFMYTCRGLFEKDKLIFVVQMAIQVQCLMNVFMNSKKTLILMLLNFKFKKNEFIIYLDTIASSKNKTNRVRLFIKTTISYWIEMSIRFYSIGYLGSY